MAEEQTKAMIEMYSKLESELATKQVELTVAERIVGKNSPFYEQLKISVEEFQQKVEKIKSGNNPSTLFLNIKSLPKSVLSFVRHYRDVMTYTSILEVLVPIYEQARFEEQKEIPVLQIIDNAVPPEKKAYPPRVLLSIAIAFFNVGIIIFLIIVTAIIKNSKNPKLLMIRSELTHFRRKNRFN